MDFMDTATSLGLESKTSACVTTHFDRSRTCGGDTINFERARPSSATNRLRAEARHGCFPCNFLHAFTFHF